MTTVTTGMKETTDFPAAVKDANERALRILDQDPTLAHLRGKTDKLTLWRIAIGIAVAEIQFPSSIPPTRFQPAPASQGASDTKVDAGVKAARARDETVNVLANHLLETDPELKVLDQTDHATAYKRAIRAAAKLVSA